MLVEPIQTEKIRIHQTIPKPQLDDGVRLPSIDVIEYSTRWAFYIGKNADIRILIEADGKIYINEKLY